MKKALLLLFVGTLLLSVIILAPLPRTFRAILVVSEILRFDSGGWLRHFSEAPGLSPVSFPGPSGPMQADLYSPRPGGGRAGILLNHGVIDTGKDDPRLKRFAEILCRAGFLVFVPEFQGMRSFRVSSGDIDEIQAACEFFLSLGKERGVEYFGLFGFSYGAGPTLIAASRPAVREEVKFVVSFGGYYDLTNVLSFLATGNFEHGGKRYFRQPQEFGKWVFLASNLDWVQSPADRAALGQIAARKLRGENAGIDRLARSLGPEGENILALLTHRDPGETEKRVGALREEIRQTVEALSAARALSKVSADLILVHGEEDDLIPFTETLRIAEKAPHPQRVYLQILRSFAHVDPDQKALTLKNLFAHHLPETWKLFSIVNRIMIYLY